MKKSNITLVAMGFAACLTAVAAPLTPQQALQRASAQGRAKAPAQNLSTIPAYTVMTEAARPAAYVFASKTGEGFTILSGDDIAYPVLGYCDKGSFDPANIPPQMQWWLGEYARQIEWASASGAKTLQAPQAPEGWAAVEPLLKTKWNQDAPYNNDCPTPRNSTDRCVTGCVATSMAQAMNYFKYPEVGTGSVTYTASRINRMLVLNFTKMKFDWANMLDVYRSGSYNDTQAAAVAYLMKACGYSVEMDYGTDVSGAQGIAIASALREYFNYDDGCQSELRLLYSSTEWAQKVYDNLKNVGPVIINGRSPQDGGHSFVCDGYDGNGYYHFNWGWGGISDGYFALEALNPDAIGIGGYAGGFNFGQNAIFGMQPPTGRPSSFKDNFVAEGNVSGAISGNTLTISLTDYNPLAWANPTDHKISGRFGIRFAPVGGGTATVADGRLSSMETVSLGAGSYYNARNIQLTAIIPALADGEYTATVMTLMDGASEWQPILVPWGYNNYVKIVKSGSSYTVTDVPAAKYTITKAEITSKIYYNRNIHFEVSIVNNTDKELTQGIAPRLLRNGSVAMDGGGVLVSVAPHSTLVTQFISRPVVTSQGSPVTAPTEYTLELYDPQTNSSYGDFGTVTMDVAPARTSVAMTDLSIENCGKKTVEVNGQTYNPFGVPDDGKFNVDFGYAVRYGYFDGSVKLALTKMDPANNRLTLPVNDDLYSKSVFMAGGESDTVVVPISFEQMEDNVIYYIEASYIFNSSTTSFGSISFIKGEASGVDGILSDESADTPVYYNLQGVKVDNPVSGQVLIRRQGSKVEKIVIR